MFKDYINKLLMNGNDTMLQKDWIVLLFTILYSLLILITFIFAMLGKSTANLLEVIKILSPIEIGVVSGVFGINIVQEFRSGDRNQTGQMPILPQQPYQQQYPYNNYNQYPYNSYNNYPYNNYQPIQQPIINEENTTRNATNTNNSTITKPPV